MRSEEFVSTLSAMSKEDTQFESIRKRIPIGVDSVGNVAYARREGGISATRHICVTGTGKTGFLRRLLITLACLHEPHEICFFILSPKTEYGELLRMRAMNATVPYIRMKSDLDLAVETLKDLLNLRRGSKGYPRLVVVLDGLENLENCNRNGDLEEYREIMQLLASQADVDVFTGVELDKSVFRGFPGTFVGVENCLIATRESGKADVTYVREDTSLSLPMPLTYPSVPSIMETVLFFNALPGSQK